MRTLTFVLFYLLCVGSNTYAQSDFLAKTNPTPSLQQYYHVLLVTSLDTWASNAFLLGGPDIEVNNTSLNFGSVTLGETSSVRTIQISSIGAEDLVIDSIIVIGDSQTEFQINNLNEVVTTIPVNGIVDLQITYIPTAVGIQNGSVNIFSNDPNESVVTIFLEGSGGGCQPISFNASKTDESCEAAQDGSITVTSVSGTSNPEYNFGNGWTTNNVATNLAIGEYTVRVRDINGIDCPESDPVTITIITGGVDNTPPTLTCPDDITVASTGNDCSAFVTIPLPALSDNCNLTSNQALHFDGINDYTQHYQTLPTGTAFTVEAWFLSENTDQTAYRRVIGWDTYTLEVADYQGNLRFNDGGTWHGPDAGQADPYLRDGNWHHVAVVYNGVNTLVYLDGNLFLTKDRNPVYGNLPGNFKIGADQDTANENWRGQIDEVRLWRIAKSQLAINADRNRELTGNENGLQAYYNFNQGVPCGDNTGQTILFDQQSNQSPANGVMFNFDFTGSQGDPCASNFTNSGPAFSLTNDFTNNPDASGTYQVGVTPVTFSASDAAGNSTDCTFNVTVTTPTGGTSAEPVIDIDASFIDFGFIPVGQTSAPVTRTITNLGCEDLIINTITLNNNTEGEFGMTYSGTLPITLVNGTSLNIQSTFAPSNSGLAVGSITILSNDSTTPNFQINLQGTGDCEPISFTVATTNVSCGGVTDGSITVTQVNGTSNPQYNFGFGWTSSNTIGGLAAGGYTISVRDAVNNNCVAPDQFATVSTGNDSEPPVAICRDLTVTLDASNNATIQPTELDGGSFDNCSPTAQLTYDATQTSFSCTDEGTNTVSLNVRDEAGNEGGCEATVTVVGAPTIGKAYIPNTSNGQLTVVDLALQQTIGAINLGGLPYGVAVNPVNNKVYVTNLIFNWVSVIDAATNTVEGTIPVGFGPRGITVSVDGSQVFVVNNIDATVSVINTNTNTVVSTFPVGQNSNGVAVSSDGDRIFAASGTESRVSVVDVNSGNELAFIYVGLEPFEMEINGDGSRIYVTNSSSNNMTVINAANNQKVNTVPVGNNPKGVVHNPVNNRVYVANSGANSITVIEGSSNNVVETISLSRPPFSLSVTPDGQQLIVGSSNLSDILSIDLSNNEVQTITVPGTLFALGEFILPGNATCNLPPEAICQDITVNIDANCQANVDAAELDGGSIDPEGSTLSFAINPQGPFTPGQTTVTLIVSDASGASSSCQAQITVSDPEFPTIACPPNQVLFAEDGATSAQVTYAFATANDNCSVESLFLESGLASGSDFPVGVSLQRFTARDFAGNTTSCSFVITVLPGSPVVYISTELEGRTDYSGSYTVDIYKIEDIQSPFYSTTHNIAENGFLSITLPETGIYSIQLDREQYLSRVIDGVSVVTGTTNVDFTFSNGKQFLVGDANEDNRVSTVDASILAATFGLQAGEDGFDARADFDANNLVEIMDFTLLASNTNKSGELVSNLIDLEERGGNGDGEVLLTLSRGEKPLLFGEEFELILMANTGTQEVDAIASELHFDPSILNFAGIEWTGPLAFELQQKLDVQNGVIKFASGTLGNFPNGIFEIAKIRFVPTKKGEYNFQLGKVEENKSLATFSGEMLEVRTEEMPLVIGTDESILQVFPNPTTGQLYINLFEEVNPEGTIQIRNSIGQVVMSQPLNESVQAALELNLPSGIYHIEIQNGRAIHKAQFLLTK